ncbi:MAG: N-formylglutamate amidohydrolase [Kiloniellaceae bacterium]
MPDVSTATESPEEADDSTLLAPDEPAPFTLVNPAGKTPLLLFCDHATRFLPRALGTLGLTEAVLSRHIAWDIGIAEVTGNLAMRLDAPAVLSHFSRLAIDPNRKLDDPTLVQRLSDGVIIPGNRDLSPADLKARIDGLYRPYHAAIDRMLEDLLARGPAPAVISMHSFTPVIKGTERPWQVGILWNEDPRLPVPLMAGLRAQGIAVGDNQPYSGRDQHGHSLHLHAGARGLANALVEVRQDLIDTHRGAAEWAERLADALSAVLADPAIFRSA